LLSQHVEPQGLGTVLTENLFILDPVRDIRRRPDVAFVSARQWPLDQELPETGDWAIVPELAVEVVSPNDVMTAVMAKRDEYFRYGVRQVWIVLPSQQEIQVWDGPGQVRAFTATATLDGDPVIPGFRQTVATLLSRRPGGVSSSTG
jgi:Uma2 family endonuclease